jgi:hypothetical protein
MKPIYCILTGFIIGVLFSYGVYNYFETPCSESSNISVKVEPIKKRIEVKAKEVDSLKEVKKKIKYITDFPELKPDSISTIKDCDSIAPIIYYNLIKCDSVVKIDSNIRASQDTIIIKQKELLVLSEAEKEALKKQVKKEKRKTLFTKVVAGVAIVVTILLVK